MFNFWDYRLAIDLGTANTLIHLDGKGVIIREPTIIARNKKTKELLAVGSEAKKMLGKNPQAIEVVRPLAGGVIADFDAAAVMLGYYFDRFHQYVGFLPRLIRPLAVVGIPGGVTEVEKRAVRDAALAAGAREAWLVEEPLAAALGAEIDIRRPDGNLLVDIGGGTTEIAVISLSGIVVGRSLKTAGKTMDEAIVKAVRLSHGLLLGEATAEAVKLAIGSAAVLEKERAFVVRGRDMGRGLPRSLKLKSAEIREVLAPSVQEIITGVVDILEETPPELVADILQHGIVLTGAGSLLPGIDQVIGEAAKMPAAVAGSPADAVVRGLAKLLASRRLLETVRLKRGLS